MCYLYNALYKEVYFLSFLRFHVGCYLIVHFSGKLPVQFFSFIHFLYPCKRILHPVCSFLGCEKESPQTYNLGGLGGEWPGTASFKSQIHFFIPWPKLAFYTYFTHRTSHNFTFVCCSHQNGGNVYILYMRIFENISMCLMTHWNLNYSFLFVLMTLSFLCGSFSLKYFCAWYSNLLINRVAAPNLPFFYWENPYLKCLSYLKGKFYKFISSEKYLETNLMSPAYLQPAPDRPSVCKWGKPTEIPLQNNSWKFE